MKKSVHLLLILASLMFVYAATDVADYIRIYFNGRVSQVQILAGDVDPSLVGTNAPIGSEYIRDNGDSFKKVGPSNFNWIRTNNTATPVGFELWEDPSFEVGVSDCEVTNGTKSHYNSIVSSPSNLKATRIQIDAEEEMTYICSKAVSANYAGTPIRHKGWLTLVSAGTFNCSIVAQWNGVDIGNAQIITSDQNTFYDLEVVPTGAGTTGYKLTCNNPTTSFTRFIVHDETSNKAERLSPVLADAKRTQSEWLSFSSNITQTTDLSSLTVSNPKGFGIYTKSADGFTFHQDADVVTNAYLYGSSATSGGSSIYLDGVTCNNATDGVTTSVSRSLPAVCATHVKAGQKITFTLSNNGSSLGGKITILATATSPTIVMQNETFNSDLHLGAWVAQPNTATCSSAVIEGEANIGKWTTCSYAINTNTVSGCTTRPTQSDSEARSQGIRIYTRAYNAASTCGNPALVYVNTGSNMKGFSDAVYSSTARTMVADLTYLAVGSAQRGPRIRAYNYSNGIYRIDTGSTSNAVTDNQFTLQDGTGSNNGYLVINASKNPVMSGVNVGRVYVHANSDSAGAIGTSTTVQVFEDKVEDTHNAYNTSTGKFTAPESGVYSFSVSVQTAAMVLAGSGRLNCNLFYGSDNLSLQRSNGTGVSNNYQSTTSVQKTLIKGQEVWVQCDSNTATTRTTVGSNNYFIISKIGF